LLAASSLQSGDNVSQLANDAGYLTSLTGAVPTSRQINTTAPLTGGGDLSADRTLAISAATTGAAGSMSSADKTKLDGIATGATVYTDTDARTAIITSSITNGDTTHSPSGDAVFDALALKFDKAGGTVSGAAIFQGDFTQGTTAGGTAFQITRPGSTPAGSTFQVSSPATVIGLIGRTGTTSRCDLRFGTNLMQFGVAGSDTTPSIQMDITETAVRAGADNSYSMGSSGRRWSVVYAATGSINTSDAREKTPVASMTENEITAAKQLANEIGMFQWLSSVQEKGEDNARRHVGMTVQRCIEIMEECSLDPFRYAFICYDKWEETPEYRDEETNEIVTKYQPAGDRYSLRPDQLNLFLARGFDARLKALEGAQGE
jgi:hypothetical protein